VSRPLRVPAVSQPLEGTAAGPGAPSGPRTSRVSAGTALGLHVREDVVGDVAGQRDADGEVATRHASGTPAGPQRPGATRPCATRRAQTPVAGGDAARHCMSWPPEAAGPAGVETSDVRGPPPAEDAAMPRLPPLTDDAWRAVVPALTGRDRELLARLTAGHSVRLMAADMGISTNTVRTRVRRLTRKLGGVPADDGGPWVAVAAALAGRDEELLALLVDGRSTSGVAAAMGLSTNTVRTRVRRLTRKMDTAIAALDGQAPRRPTW
jgi:DNA-binding CsgD family transcriptional regulator